MKRLGKTRTRFEKQKAALTQHDRDELAQFEQFLRDQKTMPVDELHAKYSTYLGLNAGFVVKP